ncbi:hypothetical protein CEUSTIGMA_g7846.t1 [Chlamydomonas eustigma]|uniref:Pherophorin domain-containing protein n=1 Tax=Chlamydomonas eustigma TaxID=1157962 RepID=A0A250XBF3_9CHLO|nr:hypothetical protein CEUSTIGMA_g7846.t1 [Chlamydomonas eustigma]|eukprot:GAX80407.1 hypothetical protein CEUSTIGMA_g7846.t1 [Chlamydomonas eustigma]
MKSGSSLLVVFLAICLCGVLSNTLPKTPKPNPPPKSPKPHPPPKPPKPHPPPKPQKPYPPPKPSSPAILLSSPVVLQSPPSNSNPSSYLSPPYPPSSPPPPQPSPPKSSSPSLLPLSQSPPTPSSPASLKTPHPAVSPKLPIPVSLRPVAPVPPKPSPLVSPPYPSPTPPSKASPSCTWTLSAPTSGLSLCRSFMTDLTTDSDYTQGLTALPSVTGCQYCLSGTTSQSNCIITIQAVYQSMEDMLQFYANVGTCAYNISNPSQLLTLPPAVTSMSGNVLYCQFMYDYFTNSVVPTALGNGCDAAVQYTDTCGGESGGNVALPCGGPGG